jgi:beta-galactosidase
MEDLGQAYGFVLYRKKFEHGIKGLLELRQAMDYTVVMVNGKTVANAFRGDGLDTNKVNLDASGPATLDLLVYNLGRISVPVSSKTQWRAHKGLIGGAAIDGQAISGWDIYSLPLDGIDNFRASDSPHVGPTFYRGEFTLDQVGGTFLDMRSWSMGVAWVNGHNLGRFWDRGGLRSLWVPGQWLKAGRNEIEILELHGPPKAAQVSGGLEIIEEPAVPFPVRLDGTAAPPPSST